MTVINPMVIALTNNTFWSPSICPVDLCRAMAPSSGCLENVTFWRLFSADQCNMLLHSLAFPLLLAPQTSFHPKLFLVPTSLTQKSALYKQSKPTVSPYHPDRQYLATWKLTLHLGEPSPGGGEAKTVAWTDAFDCAPHQISERLWKKNTFTVITITVFICSRYKNFPVTGIRIG